MPESLQNGSFVNEKSRAGAVNPRQKGVTNMKNYMLNLTEEELLYIRTALLDKNLKHCTKAIKCRNNGDTVGEQFNMERREIGYRLLEAIDAQREL